MSDTPTTSDDSASTSPSPKPSSGKRSGTARKARQPAKKPTGAIAAQPLPAKPEAPPAGAPTLTRFEAWTPKAVHRRQLLGAPYNPRSLSDKARRKLKKIIERHGIVDAPVWNERTGYLVGGHQRLKILDALEGSDDYYLTVQRIDVDEKRERELNIALNNELAFGDYDPEKLEALLRVDGLELDGTGFDQADVYRFFGGSLDGEQSPEDLEKLADELRAQGEKNRKVLDANKNRDQSHFYLVVVFKDDADRAQFLEELQLDDNRYQDGREMRRLFRVRNELEAAD